MNRSEGGSIFKLIVTFSVMVFFAAGLVLAAGSSGLCAQAGDIEREQEITPLFDGALKYPFTEGDARQCGRWKPGSQDYPYFGAPRNGNRRKHAGIDLYPAKGAGTPVKAVRDGKVMKVAPFYTRHDGEVTYAVLVDHTNFVANYAELKRPSLVAGEIVKQKQTIGIVSGTSQLHFELYRPGTENWSSWYGKMPPNLLDPTDMLSGLYSIKRAGN